ELDLVVPATGAELAPDQANRGVASSLAVSGIAGGLVGFEEGEAHRRGPGRLDPDHRCGRRTFAFAAVQVFAVAPEVAPLGGNLATEVMGRTAQCALGLVAKRTFLGQRRRRE